jgi:Zn-dependent peptidase ImmA (M78 family)
MDAYEIESAAIEMYRRAGFDPSRPVGPVQLAMALPGLSVQFAMNMGRGAQLAHDRDGGVLLRVSNKATPLTRSWMVAHELGELALHRANFVGEHAEQLASNIAAAILAPGPVMCALRSRVGFDLVTGAKMLRTSQTILALRWGEAFGEHVAIVEGSRVRRRGEIDASDADLLRIARAGDHPRRVLLVAA